MNRLKKTRTYLVGPIQYACGRKWREEITDFLTQKGISVLDPYKGQMMGDVPEDKELHSWFKTLVNKGDFDTLSKELKKIRNRDLRFVDLSDYIIGYINPKIYTCGTWEEIFLANRQKKQIFLVVEGTKKDAPYWLFGTIPHKFIFDSFEELKEYLTKIDSGEEPIENTRLHLLKEEYR